MVAVATPVAVLVAKAVGEVEIVEEVTVAQEDNLAGWAEAGEAMSAEAVALAVAPAVATAAAGTGNSTRDILQEHPH